MQILYSKGSGTDINVERIENLAVKKGAWVRGENRDDLVSASHGCLLGMGRC